MKTSNTNNITREVRITVALKFEICNFNVTAGKQKSSCPISFCNVLENKIVYTTESRRSFCSSLSWRPRLRVGFQSLDLAQKDSLLLFMI
jgi:hypothetical protein